MGKMIICGKGSTFILISTIHTLKQPKAIPNKYHDIGISITFFWFEGRRSTLQEFDLIYLNIHRDFLRGFSFQSCLKLKGPYQGLILYKNFLHPEFTELF